jgi:hypothetical protein
MITNNTDTDEIFVVKRDGTKQQFSVDKVRSRLELLWDGLDRNVVSDKNQKYHTILTSGFCSWHRWSHVRAVSKSFPVSRCCRVTWFCREFAKVFLER